MIVAGRKVVSLVGIAILGAISLMPEKSELMSRVIEDGDMSRALELIGDKPNAEAFDALILEYRNSASPRIFKEIAILVSLSDDPGSALETVRLNERYFTTEQRREICGRFAKRALELNQPATATTAYQWLADSVVLNEWELKRAIAVSRYSGRPQAAIDFIIENLQQRKLGFEKLPRSHRALLVTLNREVNQGDRALDFLKRELNLTVDYRKRWDVLDRMVTVAIQCEKLKEILPLIEEHIGTTELAKLSWKEIISRKKSHRTDPYFLKFAETVAQNYEWDSKVEKAFPYYQKLALLGNQASLKRCMEIYEWAQQTEAMRALLAHTPLDRMTFDQIASYAKLEASSAHYRKAEDLYSAALKAPDADVASVYRLRGLVILQQGRLIAALKDFEMALQYGPHDAELLDRIASIHASQGRHRDALAAYRRLDLADHSPLSLEKYSLLAETLDSEFDQLRIARHWLTKTEKLTSPNHFLKIAQTFQTFVYDREAFQALDLGLQMFPESKLLQLAKIDLLLDNEEFGAAFEEIRNSFDKSDPRFLQRVIAIADAVKDSSPMLALLDLQDPYVKTWDDGLRIDLAMLYEKLEQYDKAVTIWKSFDSNAVHLKRLRAKLACRQGRFREAVALQEEYVRLSDTADADEWHFLGEIYLLTNRSAESQRAFTIATEKSRENAPDRL